MKLDVATVLAATDARVIRWHGGEAAEAGLSPADLERVFSGVAIDSRQITADALFVALPGERADGHRYVGAALAAGALGALVARLPDELPSLPGIRYLLQTPDPAAALQRLGAHWRSHHDVEVVGITGSIGKTTTKEVVAAMLAERYVVLKSEGNLNTEIGLPLTLLRLRPEHRVAVVEMGMYTPGDIALLARLARPSIGIVTNVAPIHLERAGSVQRIARGKSELVAALPPHGLAILNGDDEWTRAMAQTSGIAAAVLVGLAPDCDYRATALQRHGLDGLSFTLEAQGESLPMVTRVPGAHTVHAFLAGVAASRALGMDWQEIREVSSRVRLDVRQRIIRRPDGTLIIDDSYNAAPMSVCAALELLREAPGTRIAVLGDMLELGPGEETAHRAVGECAAGIADWLVARGSRSAWIAEAAADRGMPADRVRQVPGNAEALSAVREIIAGVPHGCSVLVKGSRGMRMEEVVEGLRGT